MTFRRRLIVLSAAAVATAVVLASVATYVIVRADLRSGVDHQLGQLVATVLNTSSAQSAGNQSSSMNSLKKVVLDRKNRAKLNALLGPRLFSYVTKQLARSPSPVGTGANLVLPTNRLQQPVGYGQLVSATGQVLDSTAGGSTVLPVSKRTLEVANGRAKPLYADATVAGLHVRVLTTPAFGGAIQAALPLLPDQRCVLREQLDVHQQGRERRSQFVRRVGHQLAPGLRARLQRREHPVERRGQASELIVPPGGNPFAEIAGDRHPFSRRRERADRLDGGPRDEDAEKRGQNNPSEAHDREGKLELAERVIDSIER